MTSIGLLIFQNKTEKWAEDAAEVYLKKIAPLNPIERKILKSPQMSRDERDKKLKVESDLLLKQIKYSSSSKKGEALFLFDEKSKAMSSVEFSALLSKNLESGLGRINFAIGGPYGFSEEVKAAARRCISLSNMTFNHHLAQVVALEQIYRALMIRKGLPYHNE